MSATEAPDGRPRRGRGAGGPVTAMVPAVTIRKAEPSDVVDLTALAVETWVEAFGFSVSPADLSAQLEGHLSEACFERALGEDTILLAFAGGRMVGFVQVGAVRLAVSSRSEDDRELRRLYVHADVRNRGIGAQLMDAALADTQDRKADVYLDVWKHNEGARRLYERYGFEVIGAQRLVLPSGAEGDLDLIMVRRHAPT